MAVFYSNGGGDIYGGATKEAVLDAIREDIGDEDFEEIKEEIHEVSGALKMRLSNENDEPTDEMTTLEEEYVESLGAYCVASSNQ